MLTFNESIFLRFNRLIWFLQTDISRILGEKYKALSEEKKAEYKEKSRQMQEDYKLTISKF